MNIAIAGASGFVGRNLTQGLGADGVQVFALSRSKPAELAPSAIWREADLFSSRSAFSALEGADVAVYLIHSMLPSTTLFQGDFHDTDLLLADNFGKACKRHGIRKIVYLGGLIPDSEISLHLESRKEVEDVLKKTGIPVTVLRAGMIVGPGGPSFEILHSLVRRLPLMLLPEWTRRRTQAIFIDDVVRVLRQAILSEALLGKTLDLVNGEPLYYERLLRQMAEALGVKRPMFHIPINSTGFSKLWVSLFGDTDLSLVSPLVDSLLCDLPDSTPSPLIAAQIRFPTFRSMAEETLKRRKSSSPFIRFRWLRRLRKVKNQKTVRSIQRLPRIASHDCEWISSEYMRWLPNAFLSLIQVAADERSGQVKFMLRGIHRPLLELQYDRDDSDPNTKAFRVVGGLLSASRNAGWFEFRQVADRRFTLAAIHEFVPRLPWPIYRSTQALIHAWTMNRFGAHLSAVEKKQPRQLT